MIVDLDHSFEFVLSLLLDEHILEEISCANSKLFLCEIPLHVIF